ncbi:MAG: DUF2207 domain-containing protein [Bacteroidaceae bacterium]|nr:DUF2207 domain-containing protein [Bacteroidaceae bacterium]
MKRRRTIPTSMKLSRNKLLAALVLWAAAATAFAQPQLHDLDIHVVLQRNGDARITETRHMTIDSQGTECYIVVGNLGDSRLSDFSVTDETGQTYELQPTWDIDQSRQWKTNRCGIVTTRDGYELCWGIGERGKRTYTARYTVSGLLRSYPDADGFLYMFVAEGIKPSPEHVRLVIVPEPGIDLSADTARIWAFRYIGDINFQGDSIIAESSEPFQSRSAMIVMARFEKGVFQPTLAGEGTFEELKTRAFENSDYTDEMTREDIVALIFTILAFVVFPLLCFFGYIFYVWRKRRRIMKDLLWYRDLPYGGNLQQANDVLNAYKYFGADYNNLLSACILRLINDGAISIENQRFVIHQLPQDANYPQLLKMVHKIFRDAAGKDTILEPRELKAWMKSNQNQSYTDSFVQTLHTKTSLYKYHNEEDEVRKVFGLRKFLQEFTLLDERSVGEVGLWKDYMIYATLFGIAEQVIREMKRINPEYFNMDQVAQQMANETTLPIIRSTMHRSTARAAMSKAEREARASGKGGSSSWGGGGGFSGGGFGGGIR